MSDTDPIAESAQGGGGGGAGTSPSLNPNNEREAAASPADAEFAQDPHEQAGGGQHGG
ncbi:MAG: hypothetical protein M3Q48_13945 [Actinomycetota bacterium]|jgi:hypothetical protein|nr:hypothetical protein [Actinomycetota bacterium]